MEAAGSQDNGTLIALAPATPARLTLQARKADLRVPADSSPPTTEVHAPLALLDQGWARDVRMLIDRSGYLVEVRAGVPASPGAERLVGPCLPGMPNLHSHAFQRAFAGHTESRRPGGGDSFWSWRERMYGFANRITPEQMAAIARWVHVEMLLAGYTAVAEFHYVHHAPGGTPYADRAEMSLAVVAAARQAGIGITHLPVLYGHAGFGGASPLPEQARFVNDVDGLMRIVERVAAAHGDDDGVRTGIAPHSLRAVTPEALGEALDAVRGSDTPVHLHIAEQTREVRECIAWCGLRPVAWLLDHFDVDSRWCLVHATHMSATEARALAATGAVAGLCPTTEANLGDGLFASPTWVEARGWLGIGSDSNCAIDPLAELRLLEYGARLAHRRRAVHADEEQPSPGLWLYRAAAAGGAQALGIASGRLAAGARADLVVLDPDHIQIRDTAPADLLDSLLFSPGSNPVRDVMAGGHWCVRDRHHSLAEQARLEFLAVRRTLLDGQ
jgi:formimidoylglutamate deiminase